MKKVLSGHFSNICVSQVKFFISWNNTTNWMIAAQIDSAETFKKKLAKLCPPIQINFTKIFRLTAGPNLFILGNLELCC